MIMAGSSMAATITTFTSQSSWQTAVGSWAMFQFAGNTGSCLTTCIQPSTPAGTNITAAVSGNNNYSGNFNGVFQDVLTTGHVPNQTDPSLLALNTTSFTWSGGTMYAIGGLWDTSPVSEGGKINIALFAGNVGLAHAATLGPINGFFGFISDTPFTSFRLSTNNNLVDNFGLPYGVEHYTLDNLQIATAPEPATLSVLGLGLLGLGALRRYRRR